MNHMSHAASLEARLDRVFWRERLTWAQTYRQLLLRVRALSIVECPELVGKGHP